MVSRPLTLASTCHHHVMPPSIKKNKDEGDHLQSDEFLAAASHRSAEEAMRKSKPSDLNGGRDGHQTGNPMKGGGIEVPLSDTR